MKKPKNDAPNLADNEPPTGPVTHDELIAHCRDFEARVECEEERAKLYGWRDSPLGQVLSRRAAREALCFRALERMVGIVQRREFGRFKAKDAE